MSNQANLMNRRQAVIGASLLAGLAVLQFKTSRLSMSMPAAPLKPGEFWWKPDLSPAGPVAVVVSIPDQLVHVYRDGVRIGLSTCSTGRKGHETPTGVFTILQKDKDHRSSTYNNAPMPNMNRLTWSGIALHAGKLPGYPASHGCIRLPMKFSEYLFGITHIGTPVILADDHSEPAEITHPGDMLSALAEDELDIALAGLAEKALPPQQRHVDMQHAVSVLISRSDAMAYLLEDGHELASDDVSINGEGEAWGTHVYVLVGQHTSGSSLRWMSLSHTRSGTGVKLVNRGAELLSEIRFSREMVDKIHRVMHPGLVLVATDLPAHPKTRSGRDFVVAVQDPLWHTSLESVR